VLPGKAVAVSVIDPMLHEWWLRPVNSAMRVGEHSAVVWKRLYFSPFFASFSAFGHVVGPPKALEWPKPMSSISTMTMLGAPLGGLTSKRGGALAFAGVKLGDRLEDRLRDRQDAPLLRRLLPGNGGPCAHVCNSGWKKCAMAAPGPSNVPRHRHRPHFQNAASHVSISLRSERMNYTLRHFFRVLLLTTAADALGA